jgi:calcineurin-like phosphoesterase family protein
MANRRAPTIDPANTWVTSDSHFGHQNIVGFTKRPTDHEQVIMEEWARAVPDDATVLHLGDLSYRNNGMFRHVYSKHLTGERKLLIRGNHDKQGGSFYRASGFKLIAPFQMEYLPEGRKRPWIISFSHYPLKEGEYHGPNFVRIHGHIHNNGYGGKHAEEFIPFAAGQINVSVEQTHYRPVNLKALLEGYINGVYEPEYAVRAPELALPAESCGTK